MIRISFVLEMQWLVCDFTYIASYLIHLIFKYSSFLLPGGFLDILMCYSFYDFIYNKVTFSVNKVLIFNNQQKLTSCDLEIPFLKTDPL